MDISMLAAWWAVSFALVVTPGPDWACAISAGMSDRAIVPAISGTLLGYLTITLVVAAGAGAIVTAVPAVLTSLTFIGDAYLVWLGRSILANPPAPAPGAGQADSTWPRWFARGFAITGTNPKALLLFLALLPQFTSPDALWPIPAQITAMGFVQIVNCAVVYSLVGIGAMAVLRTRPRVARIISRLSGAAMIAIAMLLLAEKLQAFGRI